MADLEYFLVAESCSVDAERNSLSIFHVLNDVRVDLGQNSIPKMVVVSGWIFSDEEIKSRAEFQIRIHFTFSRDSKPNADFRGNLTAESRFQYFNFGFLDVPANAGELKVELFLDDKHKATHTMAIAVREPN